MNNTSRNPNLDRYPVACTGKIRPQTLPVGDAFWTGKRPERRLHALAIPNLAQCTREEVQAYFDNGWTMTEALFSALAVPEAYYRPAYHGLRHPLIFYYGHPAVLYVNKLRVAGLLKEPLDAYLENILEVGVDEMSWDDMSKNEMEWPLVEEVTKYRRRVYETITHLISTHPHLGAGHAPITPKHPLWSLFLGFEHERIHLETSSVLMRELPLELLRQPVFFPEPHPSVRLPSVSTPTRGKDFPENSLHAVDGRRVVLGKTQDTPYFGWDNEYGRRVVDVRKFSVTRAQITNGEFLEFVTDGGYQTERFWSVDGWGWRKFRNTKWPSFWVPDGPAGSGLFRLRTCFEQVPMRWEWPAVVNFHEAKAYCAWRTEKDRPRFPYRLLSEAEHHRLRGAPPASDPELNLGFRWASESPVTSAPWGNVWHWTEDHFNPLPGFAVHPYYDDFSTPCFDGRHQMIFGGSFASCGDEATPWARFHFRPHFFQHAGFRMATSEEVDDHGKAVRLDSFTASGAPGAVLYEGMLDSLEVEPHHFEGAATAILTRLSTFLKMLSADAPGGSDRAPEYRPTETFPETGETLGHALDTLFHDLMPSAQLPGHGGYWAYVSGGATPLSALGQWLSQTLNPYVANARLAPGLALIEREVVGWFARLVGLPASASGFLTTGSSLATLSALVAARRNRLGEDFMNGTLYFSDQVHHCVTKAAGILGFPERNWVKIPTTRPDFRMDVDELAKAITRDKAQGKKPFLVVGSAGTTNTGAIDPLSELAELCRKEGLWFHVDAAYGGFFRLTETGGRKLSGIERADSVALDPHKSLSMPYGTGCLLVKNPRTLLDSHSGTSVYMPQPMVVDGDSVDFASLSPELSRDFRGLRVWLPLKLLGATPFRRNLDEKMTLTRRLADEIRKIPELQIVAEPELTIFAFRARAGAAATETLLARLNASRRIFVSGTKLDGEPAIRVCLLSFRTGNKEIEEGIAILREALRK